MLKLGAKIIGTYFAAYAILIVIAGIISCVCSFAMGGNWGLW